MRWNLGPLLLDYQVKDGTHGIGIKGKHDQSLLTPLLFNFN